MDPYIWIMFHHPSRAAYNSGLRVLYDLAMIFNKAFFLQNMYIHCKKINPYMN